ncbi:hypothetical protein BGZ94_000381 [Podila epigama]|nr:hypothetical protein BGZ94_000381 [Podila epigama]
MPASNSEDEEDDLRYKKRRLASSSMSTSTSKNHHHSHHRSQQQQVSPPSPALNPSSSSTEVMDQVRTTLKLKQQQKAIIESRQNASSSHSTSTSPPATAPSTASSSQQQQQQPQPSSKSPPTSSAQPVTEKTPSGISVFHGSASFAALNRRPLPLTSPKNPKNAKSLTIFAPSYSESSLSIQSAPLQPSQGYGRPLGQHSHLQTQHSSNHHPMASLNPRTSQPLGLHHKQPHPFSQHSSQPTPTPGHAKKSSKGLLRQPNHDHSNSGTLPAPILSSHTGPLPSPMYPPPHLAHPSTPFLAHHHPSLATAPSSSTSKQVFLETISNLYDSVDSTKSLKFTLEEQIRKSAQLLQTLQASGTMIESLVRGQFKELEKGVIERFESELEYLAVRVTALEAHQGLTAPPAPAKRVVATSSTTTSASSTTTTTTTTTATTTARTQSSASAMTGVTSTAAALPSPPSNGPTKVSNNGTLPTPPLSKTQESEDPTEPSEDATPMEVEDDDSNVVATPPREKAHSTEYHSSVKKLQERVADLEKLNSSASSSRPSAHVSKEGSTTVITASSSS